MSSFHHNPTTPLDAIIFDCDGTLSHIEGIDELANENGVGSQVEQLTAEAMGRSGMNPEIYEKRLNLVLPSALQVETLGETYFTHKTPGVLEVIRILHALGKTIYIASAGLYPAVAKFGERIGISSQNIFAVNIFFDPNGKYQNFDRNSPLVYADGKERIVRELKKRHAQIALVGDGLNDYAAYQLVTRFIGYGGAYYRKNIEQLCEYYITEPSLMALLPYCLTAEELTTEEKSYSSFSRLREKVVRRTG